MGRILVTAAMAYCAPFALVMIYAAIIRGPVAFGLLALAFVLYIIVSVVRSNRITDAAIRRYQERGPGNPAAQTARAAIGDHEPFRPVRMRHWHEAVGPHVRRPVWTVPERRL
jgi:membrane protein implicated in regulation of membrane protease activity